MDRHAPDPSRRRRQGDRPRAASAPTSSLPGMLVGKVLRSPHAARPHQVDRHVEGRRRCPASRRWSPRDDFPDLPSEFVPAGEMLVNYRDMTRNVMAREKVLYEGHAVAAVAATSAAIAKEALKLIEVEYEVLPHVIDVDEAMAPDAPLLHDDLFTAGVEPRADQAVERRQARRVRARRRRGRLRRGRRRRSSATFDTKPVHQGYIEPHACVASVSEDGQAELWCSTQGHFIVRGHCAKLLGIDISQAPRDRVRDRRRLRRQDRGLSRAARAGAVAQGAAAGEDGDDAARRCSAPPARPPARNVWVKIGATKDGRITAAEAVLKYQAGAFPGSPVQPGAHVRVRALRPRERQGRRLRRRDQPAEGRGLPRARRADLRVRGRVRDRRAGARSSAWTRSSSA